MSDKRLNLSDSQYDQDTYLGRVQHFIKLTNPLNLTLSDDELTRARSVVEAYKNGENLGLTSTQLWEAKYQHDSAYHPDTGKKMFLPGRMSAWVPMNMTITGAMLYFQKTPSQIIFWQFANQSVNAVVNFTNRSGDEDIKTTVLARNFFGATTLAVSVAMTIKRYAPKSMSRLSPFFAVCAANALNTPLMRMSELENGINVTTKDGEIIGTSQIAGQSAILKVIGQRIMCAIPAMVVPLYGMMAVEKRYPKLAKSKVGAPLTQVALVGLSLLIANPLTCAIFAQNSSVNTNQLEPEIAQKYPNQIVYFNKGL